MPVTNVEFCVSGGDVDEVWDVKVEVDSVVNGKDNPEEVNKSVVGIEVCVTGRDVNDNDVVRIDDVLTSTPARVSCIVSSDRSEETEITRFHLEPCLESIPPLEESRDRFGDYTGRREEEVRRIQEMADLGPRRTRTRGSQDVTAADSQKSAARSVVHVTWGSAGRQTVPRPVSSHVAFSWCCGRYAILPELELSFRAESHTLSS